MELLNYTTYDEIRSLIGVSSRELADAAISLPHWTLAVEQDLLDLDGGAGAVLSQYDTVFATASDQRTAAQTQFYKVTRMFVLYHVGLQLLQRADVFSPTSISDGKATIERLAQRFDKLRPVIEGGLQSLRARVEDALQILVPTATLVAAPTRTMILAAGLGTDPVSGT